MSFVRRKRGQVLLVHNAREPGSGRIRQRVIHRFASRGELDDVLTPAGWTRWTKAVAWREPELAFDWSALRLSLEAAQAAWDEVPSGATHRRDQKIERLAVELGAALAALSRAKPSDAAVIQRARPALESLRDSIHRLIPNPVPPPEARTTKETEMNMDADTLFDEGMDYWEAGDERGAARLFRRALKLDPLHADAHNHLGILSLQARRLKEAEAHFRAAVEGGARHLDREGAQVHWGFLTNRPYLRGLANLALVLEDRKRWAEALEVHRQLLALNPDDHQGVRYLIGPECLRVGDYAGAIQAFRPCVHEEVGSAFGLALALLGVDGPAAEVGEALLFGFGQNRYLAPMLLGEPWTRLDGWHWSNMAEPEWAADALAAQADLWQAVPNGAEVLRFWWTSPLVASWRAQLDDLMVRMQAARSGEERVALGAEQRALTSPKNVLELVGRVRRAS
jgi:tetratricopeptide (TPR) repeat protein